MAKFANHRAAMSIVADIQDKLSGLENEDRKIIEKINFLEVRRAAIETEKLSLQAGAMAIGKIAGFTKTAANEA